MEKFVRKIQTNATPTLLVPERTPPETAKTSQAVTTVTASSATQNHIVTPCSTSAKKDPARTTPLANPLTLSGSIAHAFLDSQVDKIFWSFHNPTSHITTLIHLIRLQHLHYLRSFNKLININPRRNHLRGEDGNLIRSKSSFAMCRRDMRDEH